MELDRKSLASFRVLVGMARADGSLDDHEVAALKTALGDKADLLPSLLAEDVSLDHELGLLDGDERERLYESAYAVAHADGVASTFEVALLRKIVPNRGEDTLLGQVFGETLDTLLPGRILAEADPAARDSEITEDILKYSVLSAVAGAMPVPGVAIVADLAVIAIQGKMVHDIGLYFGHVMDGDAVRAFLTSVGGSALMRVAVNNLARVVPGWGMAFGAGTSFASTYAIGRVAQKYFEAGRGLDASELKSLFEEAHAEGRARYVAEQDRIDTAEVVHGKAVASLNEKLATGQISRIEYDRALHELR
ncbi:MAG: hypothetical protein ABMA64_39090 [Myxococcota bacterium]